MIYYKTIRVHYYYGPHSNGYKLKTALFFGSLVVLLFILCITNNLKLFTYNLSQSFFKHLDKAMHATHTPITEVQHLITNVQ